jgi:hypothetical protein
MDRYAQMSDIIEALEARVKALESAQNLQQQSAAPAQTVTDDALSEFYFARPLGHKGSLRAVYDLGRQHGAFANSKPTPNDRQIGSSADTGLLPMIVSETGGDDEPEIERIICSSISGGADYVNGMPRELSLQRIRYGDLHLGSAFFSARYVQALDEVAMPAPAPADGLVRMVAKRLANEISERKAGPGTDVTPIARAAIREVVDWLQQRTDTIANGSQWADLLREEAGR